MNKLLYNKHHFINYLLGTDYDRRLWDVYTGMSNIERPAYLDDILRETTQMQALLVLENVKEEPSQLLLSEEDWYLLHEKVWQDDEMAKLEVLEYAKRDHLEEVYYDILSYIEWHRLSILIRRNEWAALNQAILVNSPVTEIW
jgi:hypothetical protein